MASYKLFSRLANSPVRISPQFRYHYLEQDISLKLGKHLAQLLRQVDPSGTRPVVVVGVGTDRSTGDSLGPLVGRTLQLQSINQLAHVYGTLENPIHASNLVEKLEHIFATHSQPLIIAIDACLGRSDSVGSISLAPGPVKPGAGVNKNLPAVGDVHFTGIVNVGGYMEYFVLQNTRLSIVITMAEKIAESIVYGLQINYGQHAEPGKLIQTITTEN